MRRNKIFTNILLASAVLLAACSQDELAEQGSLLPEGAYPLQIGSVTIVAQSSEEPWCAAPQTRVAESPTDGASSVWETGDKIGVRLDGTDNAIGSGTVYSELGEYSATASEGNVSLSAVKEIYWRNHFPINRVDTWQGVQYRDGAVTAWFPSTDGSIDLKDQSTKLAYVLRGTIPGDNHYYYYEAIPLTFTHQLAKVRVLPKGSQDVSTITNIYVQGPTSCTVSEGTVTAGTERGRIKMHKATYDGIGICWEANLPADVAISTIFLEIGGNIFDCSVTPFTTSQGNLHNIEIKAHQPNTKEVDLSTLSDTYTISDNSIYYFTGAGTHCISITGGSTEIYLDNANIDMGTTRRTINHAISITGNATPTIHVVGGNNSLQAIHGDYGRAAGIYVEAGSSVIIEGSGVSDVLKITGGTDGAAIGGYSSDMNSNAACGDITIKNVTLYAYVYNSMYNLAPGIGSTGDAACGKIEITDAVVYARGIGIRDYSSPAIGAYSSVPQIVISGSTIHAYRSSYGTSYADYIGRGGDRYTYKGGQIQYGSGSITGSTIYKYSYNQNTGSSSGEGSETF